MPLVVFLSGTGPGLAGLVAVCAGSADAVVVGGGGEGVAIALDLLAGVRGERHRPGPRPLVVGRVPAGPTTAESVAHVRAAGGDGCLVDLPTPWPVDGIRGAVAAW